MQELTKAQINRQDAVDTAIHQLLCELSGKDLEWNMAHIGDVFNACQDVICNQLKLMTEMEFYPHLEDPEPVGFRRRRPALTPVEPPKRKVLIEVLGGVADVTQCPDDVEVEIIDHDNRDEEPPDRGAAVLVYKAGKIKINLKH